MGFSKVFSNGYKVRIFGFFVLFVEFGFKFFLKLGFEVRVIGCFVNFK